MFWSARMMSVVVLTVMVSVCGLVRAQTMTWDGEAEDNNWFNPVNWSGDTYPDANRDLLVEDGSPQTAEDVVVDDEGSIVLQTDTAHVDFADIYIGMGSQGILTADQGAALISGNSYLGYEEGSAGDVNLTGGSYWQVQGVYVGYEGLGTLSVNSGGELDVSSDTFIGYEYGSNGSVTVEGSNQAQINSFGNLNVGVNGSGNLQVTNGAIAYSNWTRIGAIAWGSGEVLVDGEESYWNVNNGFYVGDNGNGSLAITGGAGVDSNSSWIARGPGASGYVTVDGAGSAWVVSDLAVSHEGNGLLSVRNGGQVDVREDINIADITGASGRVTVDGEGSLLTAKNLTAGSTGYSPYGYGVGHVEILDGAMLEIDNWMTFKQDCTLTVDGGTVNTQGLKLYNPSKLHFTDGSITVGSNGVQFIVQNQQALVISDESGGSAVLTISEGGQLGHLEQMVIGKGGAGQLMLASQSSMQGDRVFLGEQAGGLGSVTVDEGSGMQSSHLVVGVRGGGSVTAANAGRIDATSVVIGQDTGSQGQIVLDGANTSGDLKTGLHVSGNSNENLLEVGRHGQGRVQLINGAEMTTKVARIAFGSDSQGEIIIHGTGSSWKQSDGNMQIGYFGRARFELSDGATADFSNHAVIGFGIGGWGEVFVTGAGSHWNSNSELVVGEYGGGDVAVEDGGRVDVNELRLGVNAGLIGSSLGSVNVHGVSSRLNINSEMIIGELGSGLLAVSGGGELTSGTTYVGRYDNSHGQINVSGPGSLWTCKNYLYVGYSNGSEFSDGAVLVSDDGHVKVSSGLEVYDNSRLVINGGKVTAISVSINEHAGFEFTDGHLEITGGYFSGPNQWLEFNGEGGGAVTVDMYDQSNLHILQGLLVGGDGIARVHLHDTAEAFLDGDLVIGETETADGLVTFMDDFSVDGSVMVGGSLGGVARLESLLPKGVLVVTGDANVGPEGEMIVRGVVEGDLINGGVVDPFSTKARITVNGNYEQWNNGRLVIDIAMQDDANPVMCNMIEANTVVLDGELEIVVEDGYLPTLGRNFGMMTFAERSGRFASVTGDEIAGEEDMRLAVLYNAEDITLKAALVGDANLDGVVGLLDLDSLGDNWLAEDVDWRSGDFNNDGVVGLLDLDLLGRGWGNEVTSSPEPGSVVLLLIGGAVVIKRR